MYRDDVFFRDLVLREVTYKIKVDLPTPTPTPIPGYISVDDTVVFKTKTINVPSNVMDTTPVSYNWTESSSLFSLSDDNQNTCKVTAGNTIGVDPIQISVVTTDNTIYGNADVIVADVSDFSTVIVEKFQTINDVKVPITLPLGVTSIKPIHFDVDKKNVDTNICSINPFKNASEEEWYLSITGEHIGITTATIEVTYKNDSNEITTIEKNIQVNVVYPPNHEIVKDEFVAFADNDITINKDFLGIVNGTVEDGTIVSVQCLDIPGANVNGNIIDLPDNFGEGTIRVEVSTLLYGDYFFKIPLVVLEVNPPTYFVIYSYNTTTFDFIVKNSFVSIDSGRLDYDNLFQKIGGSEVVFAMTNISASFNLNTAPDRIQMVVNSGTFTNTEKLFLKIRVKYNNKNNVETYQDVDFIILQLDSAYVI